jgi:hypothetical protein
MADPNANPVLSERWLRWASRWVRWRPLLARWAAALAVALAVALLGYSAYSWLDYLWLSAGRERQLYQELSRSVDARPLHEARAPQSVRTLAAVVLSASGRAGAYDVLAKLSNPNPQWLADVSYQVVADGVAGPVERTFVLNDEEKFVIGVGLAAAPGAQVEVRLLGVAWQRLREPALFNDQKPRFLVSDPTAAPVSGGATPLTRVAFTVTNESINSFWSVGFTVIVVSGDRPVAARYTTIEQVRSGERREVSLNLPGTVPAGSRALVIPEVNVADSTVFMPVSGLPITF